MGGGGGGGGGGGDQYENFFIALIFYVSAVLCQSAVFVRLYSLGVYWDGCIFACYLPVL